MTKPTKSLEEIEKEIKEQLDRIYKLLDEKKNPEFIKLEYKRIVELISQKYLILKDELAKSKRDIGEKEHGKQEKALTDQYKDDIISIAVAIDETLGLET